MAKLLISNDKKARLKMESVINLYFKKSAEYLSERFDAVVYKKLNIQSQNFLVQNEDFVFTSGTVIYKKEFGSKALSLLLHDANTKTVKEIRKNLLGSYVIVIKVGNIVKCFLDETHTYSFYYYMDKEKYILTNTYYHIADCINAKINDAAFLEKGIRRCIMSNRTPYKEIYKLGACECFEANLETGEFGIVEIELNDYSQKFDSREEAMDCLINAIKEISSIRSKFIKNYMHFLTGGIDSRLELAINSYNKDHIALGYWMGKDVITNGTASDISIAKSVSKEYGYSFTCFDVEENFADTMNNITKEKSDKYGELASIYCGNSRWLDIFETMKNYEYIGFGCFGECMRSLSDLERSYTKNYKLIDFITDVYCRSGLEKYMFKLDGFYSAMEAELLELLDRTKLLDKSLSKDTAFKLFNYSRFEADCAINNFVNLFAYSFLIFGQKKVADIIFSLQYDWLKDDSVSISLIKAFDENLLSFPIYSHHRKFIYDSHQDIIKKSNKYVLIDWLKPIIFNTPIYTVLYLKFAHKYIRPQSEKNDEIIKECKRILNEVSILNETKVKISEVNSWKGIEIASLATFVSDIKIMNNIQENDNNV